jgi:hypothetical protein
MFSSHRMSLGAGCGVPYISAYRHIVFRITRHINEVMNFRNLVLGKV